MNPCNGCPHPTDCAASKCLTERAAPFLEVRQFSRWMTASQARDVEIALRAGKSLRRFTAMKQPIVTLTKFKTHVAAYPIWGSQMIRLAEENRAAADALKGKQRGEATHCGRGHPFSDNRDPRTGFRRCMVCQGYRDRESRRAPPERIAKVKKALAAGLTMTAITKAGSPQYIINHQALLIYRRKNLAFGEFVLKSIAGNNSRGQQQRAAHKQLIVAATPKDQNAYYREISGMVPRYLPDYVRDDIVQSVFMALLDGSLRHADVKQRIGIFVSDHNRMFPTKYAMRSLDAPAFSEGAMPLIETISQGLWQ